MSHNPNQNRNYLKELRCLLTGIREMKMEPEICNVTCPPLGCPRGPCPGICRDERGCLDPCCMSKMPCSSDNPQHASTQFIRASCCFPRNR